MKVKGPALFGFLAFGLAAAFLANLAIGTAPMTLGEWLRGLRGLVVFWEGNTKDGTAEIILGSIRLPRAALAVLVGGGLAAAGTVLQGIFRNPLADPGLIGVSSGGTMGAVTVIIFLGSHPVLPVLTLPAAAFFGSLGTTWLVYRIAQVGGRLHVSTLLLAGIALNAFAGAYVAAAVYLSSNDALREFTYWSLGSLTRANPVALTGAVLFIAFPLVVFPFYARALNALLLGEPAARHLGIDPHRTQKQLIWLSAAVVGSSVAFCGLIAFVGLVVPHLLRLVTGPDHRRLLPASMLGGGILLLLADLLARTLQPPLEVPVGIFTALLGAPFFLALILRRKRQLAW